MVKPLENAEAREPGRYKALTLEDKIDYWHKRLPWCEQYKDRLTKRLGLAREKGRHRAWQEEDETALESEIRGAQFLIDECLAALKKLEGGNQID